MRITALRWTSQALGDVARLRDFLADVNPRAASQVVRSLIAGAAKLRDNPRLGTPLRGYEPGEVRRIIVGSHELRYEVNNDEVLVLRVWHTRESC